MHPDCILIENHGVTSPRLNSTLPLSDRDFALANQIIRQKFEIESSEKYSKKEKFSRSYCPKSQLSSVEAMSANVKDSRERHNFDENDLDEAMSCASEISDLSVGQEFNSKSEVFVKSINYPGKDVQARREVDDESESVGNCSLESDDNQPAAAASDQLAGDEASSDSIRDNDFHQLPAADATLVIRPSPTRLQEEFIRKSSLYAEELMKQQMQFVAAARATALQFRQNSFSSDLGEFGFRSHVRPQNHTEDRASLPHFTGIHSHLSAISKISSKLAFGESPLSRLTTFGFRPTSDVQPPNDVNNMPDASEQPAEHNFLNNNINDSNLKFSIENILRADFGRCLEDPQVLRTNRNSSVSGQKSSNRHHNHSTGGKHSKPIDLTQVPIRQLSNTVTENFANSVNGRSSTIIDVETNSHADANSKNSLGKLSENLSSTASQLSSDSSQLGTDTDTSNKKSSSGPMVWPAWVYCTRYSDRPSSGRSPRTRKPKKPPSEKGNSSSEEKRPRTAFSGPQLARLKHEFSENRYLTERRRQQLSAELGLNEAQIKIWFQNKRAKIKKSSGTKNPLALQLMAQGLYNHSTVPLTREEEELQELQSQAGS